MLMKKGATPNDLWITLSPKMCPLDMHHQSTGKCVVNTVTIQPLIRKMCVRKNFDSRSNKIWIAGFSIQEREREREKVLYCGGCRYFRIWNFCDFRGIKSIGSFLYSFQNTVQNCTDGNFFLPPLPLEKR